MLGYIIFLAIVSFYILVTRVFDFALIGDIQRILVSVLFSSFFFTLSDVSIKYGKNKKHMRKLELKEWTDIRSICNRHSKTYDEMIRTATENIDKRKSPMRSERISLLLGDIHFLCGSVCLCLLLGFTQLSEKLTPLVDVFTLFAFILVLSNYLATELFEKSSLRHEREYREELLKTEKMINEYYKPNDVISDEGLTEAGASGSICVSDEHRGGTVCDDGSKGR